MYQSLFCWQAMKDFVLAARSFRLKSLRPYGGTQGIAYQTRIPHYDRPSSWLGTPRRPSDQVRLDLEPVLAYLTKSANDGTLQPQKIGLQAFPIRDPGLYGAGNQGSWGSQTRL